MRSMHNIKEPLGELNNMIGMNGLKDSIVDQIVYFVQNLHINKNAVNPDFMHTCIYGPPGTGKTEIAKIMGKIFSSLGVLNKKNFKKEKAYPKKLLRNLGHHRLHPQITCR